MHVFPRNDPIREYRRGSYKPVNSYLTLKAPETPCSTLVRTFHWSQLCQQPRQKNIQTPRSPLISGSSPCELSLLLTLPTSRIVSFCDIGSRVRPISIIYLSLYFSLHFCATWNKALPRGMSYPTYYPIGDYPQLFPSIPAIC